MGLATIEEAVAQLRNGGMVVVVDDEDRENEGDLVMAAEDATAESMAFYLEYTSGIFCVPLESQRADELDLPLWWSLTPRPSARPLRSRSTIATARRPASPRTIAPPRCAR